MTSTSSGKDAASPWRNSTGRRCGANQLLSWASLSTCHASGHISGVISEKLPAQLPFPANGALHRLPGGCILVPVFGQDLDETCGKSALEQQSHEMQASLTSAGGHESPNN